MAYSVLCRLLVVVPPFFLFPSYRVLFFFHLYCFSRTQAILKEEEEARRLDQQRAAQEQAGMMLLLYSGI